MSEDVEGDQSLPGLSNEDHETTEKGPAFKKRKIHMDRLDCQDYTEHDGGVRLKNPTSVSFSSKDPNRGLYPRPERNKSASSTMGSGFVTASEVMNPQLPFAGSSQARAQTKPEPEEEKSPEKIPPWLKGKQARKKLPSQSNTLDKYCVKGSSSATSSQISSQSSQSASSSQRSHSASSSQSSQSAFSSQSSQSASCAAARNGKKTTMMYSPIKKVSPNDASSAFLVIDSDDDFETSASQSSVTKKLFDAQKSKPTAAAKSKRPKKEPKKPQKFSRDNSFLYSNDPMPQNSVSSSDKYGLLGKGTVESDEDPEQACLDDMPNEVLENIFCRMPLMDLCLNVNTVCKRWNDIISEDRFVPWKKRYFRMKHNQTAAISEMTDLMKNNEMPTTDKYLLGLIKFMKDFKPVTARNMLECLQQHPKYMWAADLIKERCPECVINESPSPWSIIACLCVISESVRDIERIGWVLLSHRSQCTALEVTEALYAVLCFLWMFKSVRFHDVWNGMHYRVFYGLYLFENESSCTMAELSGVFKGSSGQQSLMRYSKRDSNVKYTHEQLRICSYNVKPQDVVKIVAFAGTGKTTTLVRYTQLRPNKRFLLVVYNKAIKEHSASVFPGNVTCKTGHGLAFAVTGRRYGAKNNLGNLRVHPVTQTIQARKGESLYVQAKFVIDTISTFVASADEFITTAHVPNERVDDNGKRIVVDHQMKMNLVADAETIWSKMKDENNSKIPMTHDGYLKLYQLRKPKLWNYDIILIDEAQDLTPAIADILLTQTQPKLLVGDPHQQIYAFRGAVNAMEQIEASHTFYLTQSFRFGPEIAFVASTCLEFLKNEKKKTIVGNKEPGGIMGEICGQLAVITRTNFQLFSEAVKKCCFSEDPVKVAFAGGISNFGFDMILDIYLLMLSPEDRNKRGGIKNALVSKFSSLGEFEKYATKTMDNELLGKIKIVRTFHSALPGHIAKIKSKLTSDESTADIIFSTAHKAKGLEFSTVRLTDDFNVMPNPMSMTQQQRPGDDESNLLYVAATRAKKRLIITEAIVKLLEMAGEKFRYPEYTKQPSSSDNNSNDKPAPKLCCMLSNREFTPNALTVTQRTLKLSSGAIRHGGAICPQLITEEYSSLRGLYGALKDERTPEEREQADIAAENREAFDMEFDHAFGF